MFYNIWTLKEFKAKKILLYLLYKFRQVCKKAIFSFHWQKHKLNHTIPKNTYIDVLTFPLKTLFYSILFLSPSFPQQLKINWKWTEMKKNNAKAEKKSRVEHFFYCIYITLQIYYFNIAQLHCLYFYLNFTLYLPLPPTLAITIVEI